MEISERRKIVEELIRRAGGAVTNESASSVEKGFADLMKKPKGKVRLSVGEGREIQLSIKKGRVSIGRLEKGFFGRTSSTIMAIDQGALYSLASSPDENKATPSRGRTTARFRESNDTLFEYSNGSSIGKGIKDFMKGISGPFAVDESKQQPINEILKDIKAGIVFKPGSKRPDPKELRNLLGEFDKGASLFLNKGGSVSRTDLVEFLSARGIDSEINHFGGFQNAVYQGKGANASEGFYKKEGGKITMIGSAIKSLIKAVDNNDFVIAQAKPSRLIGVQ